MAEPVSIIASAITVGVTAAQLSFTLFNVAQTFKNARAEISEIAHELSGLSQTLETLGDLLQAYQPVCKPALFRQVLSILTRFKEVEEKLKKKLYNPRPLRRLRWFFNAPVAKTLLKKVESIKTSLTLVIGLVQLASEEIKRHFRASANDTNTHEQASYAANCNRYRKVVESVVQANRLAVEKAKEDDDAHPTEKRRHYNSSLQRWQADSNDTATWLYHLVFMTGVAVADAVPPAPPHTEAETKSSTGSHQATVEDYDTEASKNAARAAAVKKHRVVQFAPSPKAIVWNQLTEPSTVVDRLLHTWTFLSDAHVQTSGRLESEEEGPDERILQLEDIVHKIEEKVLKGEGVEGANKIMPHASEQFSNDPTDERIAKMEHLLHEQLEQIRHHSAIEEQWRNEKFALEAKVTEAAKEVKELREKSIAKAKAAKKAAQKSLKFVEKTVAETKLDLERKKIERDYNSRLDAYERRLTAFLGAEQKTVSPPTVNAAPVPSRRTCVFKGDCRIEVSEFFDGQSATYTPHFDFDNIMHSQSLYSNDDSSNLQAKRSGSNSQTSGLNEQTPSRRLLGAPDTQRNDNNNIPSVVTLPSIDYPSARTRELQARLRTGGFISRSSVSIPSSMDIAPYVDDASSVGGVQCTICWEPPTGPLGSDLIRTLRSIGWKPFYARTSEAGHTYFVSSEPVHVHFFTPDYKPQFTAAEARQSDHLLISGDLVEEYALLELGFQFEKSNTGAYVLDGRLTAAGLPTNPACARLTHCSAMLMPSLIVRSSFAKPATGDCTASCNNCQHQNHSH
ncbi:uncharacterized protein EI97DRAFT_370831 [Westerdykella ornata]|uniref:Fungal N-terminal domain-containing protein n=1 Tax=Westerdykella ornata TaxID=318751 RepID=A0A6A6JT50_WESOR|nr:uncharacterized protein EI97DRAFT_370831 [Westerdykella ornata]KAF2279537.1 hypothetical protein EI97DRAFT_370831 [Westerdykella ornata]